MLFLGWFVGGTVLAGKDRPVAYFPINGLVCLGRRSSCSQTGTTSSCRREIKSGYKFCKMFITIYLVKITLFYVFISCRFKLNVLVLYKNMFHLRTTIFLSIVCCSVDFI